METIKRLVLVVHGIGEQEPGETLDSLAGAATGNIAGSVQAEKRWLRDEHDEMNPRAVDLFACEVRRVTTKLSELVFAEVYWADLSRGKQGKLATLYELVKGILGLGHVVRENAEEIHPNGHWLRTLSSRFVTALHGPIAVLNFLLAAGVFVLYLANFSSSQSHTHLAVFLLAAGSALLGKSMGNNSSSYLFRIFCRWLYGLSVLLAIAVIATVSLNLNGTIPVRDWYSYLLIEPLRLVWFLTLISVLIMTVTQAFLDPKAQNQDPKSLYSTVCAVMIVLWLLVASSFWATLPQLITSLPGDFIIDPVFLRSGTDLMFAVWVSVFIVVIAAVVAWVNRLRWAKRNDRNNYKDEPLERLIFNPRLRRAFIAGLVLLTFLAIVIGYIRTSEPGSLPHWLPAALDKGHSIGFLIAIAAGSLYVMVWSQIAVGLGIAKDIITYFKGEPDTQNPKRYNFPMRTRMLRRFNTVMETMIASEEPDEVVIISHSQGTVIAIEAIKENTTSMLFEAPSIKTRSLVTMGSPYSHIYGHYFPTKFKLPDDFKNKFSNWLNIFRIDDFVGTIVGEPDGSWPQNIPVNPKGHTGYWRDDEVREILIKSVLPEVA